MVDNRENFCKEANEFLYRRGYFKIEYFMTRSSNHSDIYFYPEFFAVNTRRKKITHNNGKIFDENITDKKNFKKYKKWICELLKPIMKKYKINNKNIY